MAPEEGRGRFHEALVQLQNFHETEVASLTSEVARLRTELEVNRHTTDVPWQVQQLAIPRPLPAPLHRSEGAAGNSLHHAAHTHVSALADRPQRRQSQGLALADGSQRRKSLFSSLADRPHTPRQSHGLQKRESHFSALAADGSQRWQFDNVVRRMSVQATSQLGMGKSPSRSMRDSIRDFQFQKGWRGTFERVLQSQPFNIIIGLLIALNAACIGIESSIVRAGQETPAAVDALEYCFVAVYTVELAMRLVAQGVKALTNRWIQFDVFLAICGILGVVSKLMMTGEYIGILGKVLLLRILRLARLARIFRAMTKFNTLWLLVQGLMNSIPTLACTATIIGILLYVFAVVGLELLLPDSQASAEYSHLVNTHFGNIFSAMLTLLQGLTLDSFSNVYRPIMNEKPYTVLYFVPFLLTVSIALMNLVTAIMVNLSLEQTAKDKKLHEQMETERKGALAKLLKDMFVELDTDGSDRVDMTEMMNAPEEMRSLVLEIADIGTPGSDSQHDLKEIFDILDFDSSGDVEICEFVDGLLKLHNDGALDAMRFQKQCKTMMTEMLSTVTHLAPRSTLKSFAASNSWCASGQDNMPSAAGMPSRVLLERPEPALDACSVELSAASLRSNDSEDFLPV